MGTVDRDERSLEIILQEEPCNVVRSVALKVGGGSRAM